MRASTSRACGSVCSVGTAAPPSNSPRSSPASTTARTRFTRCTGARSEPTRSEWSRRCAITTISTRSSTTRSWCGGSSCRRATGDGTAMMLNPVDRSLLRLLLYYVLLVAGTIVLARYVPAVRRAVSLEGPPPGITAKELRRTLEEGGSATGEATAARPTPATTTALAMIGALALVIPVARVYMLTKQRQGYDPSVVQTVILLPVAVAGTVAVVQNSLALAFSLAGLAAAVRFRNTLQDSKDAVYIFVAMGVGIAAGVQALALCFVMTVIYNVSVVTLWTLNVGDTYPGEPRPSFTGEFAIAAASPAADDELLVDADPTAQRMVERALDRLTKRWRLVEQASGTYGRTTLTYEVRLKKKTTRAALIEAIAREAAPHVATAAFRSLA